MVTGKPRQGIRRWPKENNMLGKELLGRYDMSPNPNRQESLGADGCIMPPPTSAPTTPGDLEVPGTVMCRLWTKTNCSGAVIILDARTQRNKDKIRNLRLRKNLTGTVERAKQRPAPPSGSEGCPETLTLDQAVDRYLREPPPLPRLRTKSKPPAGYIRFGPKDAPEAIA